MITNKIWGRDKYSNHPKIQFLKIFFINNNNNNNNNLILIELLVFIYLFISVDNLQNGCNYPVENWQMWYSGKGK